MSGGPVELIPRNLEPPLVRVMLEIRHRRRFHRDGFTKPPKDKR